MKVFLLISFCSLTSLSGAKGQSMKDFFNSEGYRHTLNYGGNKIMFYTLPNDGSPRYTFIEKKYYWYSNNHIGVTQGGYSGRLLDGLYADFYHNKSLKEQGRFKKGLKQGVWKSWNDDGILNSVMNYRGGILNGKYIKYDTLGAIKQVGHYRSDKLNGRLKTIVSADSIRIETYRHGVIVPPNALKWPMNWLEFFKKKERKDSVKNKQPVTKMIK